MTDTTHGDDEVVESLRSIAAWLDPELPVDIEDRRAVHARWNAIDKAAETLGELAGWDQAVLRAAAGVVDDDDEICPGHTVLVSAAIRAEHLAEPLEVSADRVAFSALLGAMEAITDEARASWVQTLAGHHSSDPPAALALARKLAPAQAWAADRNRQIDAALQLLAEAEAACRRSGR